LQKMLDRFCVALLRRFKQFSIQLCDVRFSRTSYQKGKRNYF